MEFLITNLVRVYFFHYLCNNMKQGFKGERSIVLPQMVVEMEKNDPLVSSLYITDIGYYPHAEGHFRERLEGINEYILIYCMEGKGWFRIMDENARHHQDAVDIMAGQYVILPSGVPHAYGTHQQTPWTIYWIHFRGTHADIYAEDAGIPHNIHASINSRINERNNIFEDIFSTLSQSQHLESLRYASSLLHYYLASMRYLNIFRHTATEKQEQLDITEAAIHFLNENIEKKLTLANIAYYIGFSPAHFSRIFHEKTGESPLAFFNKMKMERAMQMLIETDLRINQICHKVGIEDNYYFSRLFRRHTGLSPKAYREKFRGSEA